MPSFKASYSLTCWLARRKIRTAMRFNFLLMLQWSDDTHGPLLEGDLDLQARLPTLLCEATGAAAAPSVVFRGPGIAKAAPPCACGALPPPNFERQIAMARPATGCCRSAAADSTARNLQPEHSLIPGVDPNSKKVKEKISLNLCL